MSSRSVFVLIVVLAAFAAGAVTAVFQHWGQPLVSVSVANESGQELQSLVVTHESMRAKGQIEVKPPRIGAKVLVRFFQEGEGSVLVTAKLANGQVVEGIGGYVEPGYSLSMSVTPTGITGALK